MVDYTTNNYGYIDSFIEWEIIKDIYIYVANLWVHYKLHEEDIINHYTQKIGAINPQIKYVYWTNKKHGERMVLCEMVRSNGKIKLIKRRIQNG